MIKTTGIVLPCPSVEDRQQMRNEFSEAYHQDSFLARLGQYQERITNHKPVKSLPGSCLLDLVVHIVVVENNTLTYLEEGTRKYSPKNYN